MIVSAWELGFRAGLWQPHLFPAPSGVWNHLVGGIGDGTLFSALAISMQRAFIGYGISLLLGISLGFLMGGVRWIGESIGSVTIALQSLPAACWLPVAILWFGFSETAILFVIVIGGSIPIAVATNDGIRHASPLLINAAKTMGATRKQLAIEVILPASLPMILSGMKLGWAFAWRALMTGELLFVTVGLGRLLETGRKNSNMEQVVAVMVLLVLISVLVDRLILDKIQKKIRRIWGLAVE